jgi:hypothetical protein
LDNIEVQLEGEIKVYITPNIVEIEPLWHELVHRRYRLLASKPLLLLFPEIHHFLGLGWSGYQDFRKGYSQRQWSGVVQCLCWPGSSGKYNFQ